MEEHRPSGMNEQPHEEDKTSYPAVEQNQSQMPDQPGDLHQNKVQFYQDAFGLSKEEAEDLANQPTGKVYPPRE